MPTTIKLKNSVTTTSVPSSLVQGEVAINITDKKVWVGNAATTPIQIAGAGTTGNAAGSNTQVQYNSSGSFAGSANFTFNGTTVTMANDASISGLTVGKGGGAVASNTTFGASALASNSTGTNNTAIGNSAMLATTGSNNVGVGDNVLRLNSSGGSNTAMGNQALYSNTTASNNTAVGFQAVYSNTTGTANTALGLQALYANTTASSNTAIGYQSAVLNTTGANNVAVGESALRSNTTASNNTAVGYQAGYSTTTAGGNTFIGRLSGYSTTGIDNTFVGITSGYSMTTGTKNTILGGFQGNQGGLDIRTASNYVVLSDGDGNWAMWSKIGVGTAFANVASGAGTNALKFNTTTGVMTYDTSSARYKDNIRDSKYGLADVMKMRSAQFEYKDDGRSDVGFIAEEMLDVIPEVVAIDKQGRADAVAYDRLVSVCVKAIQELKAEVDSLKQQLGK
jgi:hypothetical protein